MKSRDKHRIISLPIMLTLAVMLGMLLNSLLQHGKRMDTKLFMLPKDNKLDVILSLIDEDYVDTISKDRLIEQTIPELLKDLDPHTVYIPAKSLRRVNEELKGNFGGIGIQFIKYQDTVAVVKVIPGGPSERIGIMAGDRIVMVNDSLIAGVKMGNIEIMNRLKGPSGTPVKVSILRRGEPEIKHLKIIRGQIPVASVDIAYMLDNNVGYIKINRFAATTFIEFSKGLEKLKNQGLEKLIIDLRGNQGGYLSEATKMANEFLPDHMLIVYTMGKSHPRTDYMSNGNGTCQTLPVTVLMDEFSASASEVFAGAIQDNDRGKIVGRRSFGKGLVQEQRMLPDGSALRLTVARYYTPTGRSIQKPYENGKAEYYNDIHNRILHGEFVKADSIHFIDSLKFTTPDGTVVYGGGGIMPDIFVPADTSGRSQYLNLLVSKELIYKFAFSFVDNRRMEMSRFKSYKEIVSYLDTVSILENLVAYAEKNGEPRDDEGLKTSRKIIETQLKAYIARNLIDDEGFYPIIHGLDQTLQKAHELMQ